MTLDNNNDVLADFWPFFLLYTLSHTSVGLTGCISIVFSVLNILTHFTTMLPVRSLVKKKKLMLSKANICYKHTISVLHRTMF